jgi:signal transduction histidine kinase
MPEDTLREVRALRSLHDLITSVHLMQDLAEVLQAVTQGVVDVLGFRVAVINAVDDYGHVEAVAVAGDDAACAALRGRRMPLAEYTEEFALADHWGSLRFVPHDRLPADVASSWIPDVEPLDVPDAWHPLDALYAPMHGPGGDLLGVLGVDLPKDGMRPRPLDRQILEMYAVQAGLAIHHAQERERLQERVRLAAATRTIIETASRELDLTRVVDQSFRPLREGFRCDRLLIRVFDGAEEPEGGKRSEGETFPPDLLEQLKARVEANHGADEHGEPHDFLGLGEAVARACWDRGRTCVVAELGDTSEEVLDPAARATVDQLLEAVNARTLVLVPLGDGPACLGYLTILRGEPTQAWHPAEDEAALEVGREIGRAVARARLYERERQLVTELKELDECKGEMIATITHELKNPLASIAGHVELLQEADAAPVSVDAIARNVARLQTLVEDMLLLSRVKDPHQPFVPVLLDLSGLVKEVCDLLAVQATRRGQSVDTSAVDPGVLVWGERDELARLVTNVLSNAMKYSPEGGRVQLSLHDDGAGAVIACSDTGIGIADTDLGSLFEEFDRSSNPVAHAVPGTGLGLAIVRRIVDRHGGEIAVSSALGKGSTFTVTLPFSLQA